MKRQIPKSPTLFWIGVILSKKVIPGLNRTILRIFGWKKAKRVYKTHGWVIMSSIVWKDPMGEHDHPEEDEAIEICKKRLK